MRHAERGEQRALHQSGERLAHALGGEHAEQADAGVGIAPVCARRVFRLPLAVIGEHAGRVDYVVRELQRQPAGGVGAEVEQAGVFQLAALQLGPVLAGAVGEGQLAGGLGQGGEGGGKRFAERADFKQGVAAHRLRIVQARHAVVEVVRLAVMGDRHGHTGDGVFRHERANGFVHPRLQCVVGVGGAAECE